MLLDGLKNTIIISLLAILTGLIIGLVTCALARSKFVVLRALAKIYVWCVRGTPMIVQAFVVFFAFPQVIQMINPTFRIDAFTAGYITLSINAGAYMSEIFRGGIDAVSHGQVEAARSLGMSKMHTTFKVVLPQAFKICIPSLVNQFIITVKDSSILTCIGLPEVVNKAQVYVGKTYAFFPTYILVAIFYLVVISILMIISKFIEKNLQYETKRGRRNGN